MNRVPSGKPLAAAHKTRQHFNAGNRFTERNLLVLIGLAASTAFALSHCPDAGNSFSFALAREPEAGKQIDENSGTPCAEQPQPK